MILTFSVLDVSRAEPPAPRIFTDIALDANGDLDTSTGDLRLLGDQDAVVQDIDTRLGFFRGEWFLDLDEGVPYYEEILVKNPRLNVVRAILTEAMLGSPLVTEVNDLTLDYDAASRTLDVTATLVLNFSLSPIDYSKRFVIGAPNG